MDLDEATTAAKALIGPIADLVTAEQWASSAATSLVPDEEKRLPGSTGYAPTYEPYWLAAEVIEAYAITQQLGGGALTSFTSEGASFQFVSADLFELAGKLRSKSPISRVCGGLGRIQVDGGLSDYVPTSGRRLAGLPTGVVVPENLDWT